MLNNDIGDYRWRRDTSWWDTLAVPNSEVADGDAAIFTWLESNAPEPAEHDFILYTDGSGCSEGWGGYAAVIQGLELNTETERREIVSSKCLFGGTYGSTVQRTEMTAFLDGVHAILSMRIEALKEEALYDEALKQRIGRYGAKSLITGADRVTILWYTDRSNLAKSLLFDENDDMLNSRATDRDLWLRWSAMSVETCVTPLSVPRNSILGQATCDSLAGHARKVMKDNISSFAAIAGDLQQQNKWTQKQNQSAQF